MSTPSIDDPIGRFRELYERATRIDRGCVPDPNAMMLATVGADGQPSVRVVLLKAVDERGFVFYTNFEGRKGRELLANPRAALCFYWAPLGEQVRVEGSAYPVSTEEADAYFATRSRGSQLGAWASLQSEPIDPPGELGARLTRFIAEFEGRPVKRPPHWSGFLIVPERIEFWLNRESRLHDRDLYIRDGDRWRIERLYP
jgi:pyridoxamine 5'-phosphate oxidase